MNRTVKYKTRQYREDNRDVLEYKRHKYHFSNPLKVNQGKNWKCVIRKCLATLKTETDGSGGVSYKPRFPHNHDPIVFPKKKKISFTKKKRSSSVKSIDSDYGTLRAQDMNNLPNQIQCLIQEIVTKQMEIDKLKEKSNEDGQLIQSMIHRIQALEEKLKTPRIVSEKINKNT
uniref:Uncharacterized protein n=1 Tax=Cacopsylla melanoneura TaxID=428564 RepID=A0A8D9BG67_9HEMI